MRHTRSQERRISARWSLGGLHPFAGRGGPYSGVELVSLGLDLEKEGGDQSLTALAKARIAEGQERGRQVHSGLVPDSKSTDQPGGSGRVREAVVRYLRQRINSISIRIDVGRSYGAAVRAELQSVGYAEPLS